MKFLLTLPPYRLEDQFDFNLLGKGSEKIGSVERPLGITYLASMLLRDGFDVEILDTIADNLSESEFENILKQKNFDVCGISVVSNAFYLSVAAAKIAKKINPKCFVVIGGPHVISMQRINRLDTIFESGYVDFAISGEGELTTVELAKALESRENDFSKIDGLVWKRQGKLIINKPRAEIENLDEIPFPAFELLKSKGYKRTPSSFRKEPVYPIMIGRGCPYNCVFCNKIFGRHVRFRSVDNVIKELLHLKGESGAKEIRFWDETLTLDKKYIIELCKKIIELKLDLSWSCYGHVNTFDEEAFRWMKKAGCWEIDFGVEAGTNKVLKEIDKGITVEQVIRDIRLVKKAGMEARCFFILGLPGDDEESIKETINFAIRADPDYAMFYILSLYPGTRLWDIEAAKNKISNDMLDNYLKKGEKIFYSNPNISNEKLEQYLRIAHRKFYKRPSYILKRILKIRNPSDLKRYARAGKVMLKI